MCSNAHIYIYIYIKEDRLAKLTCSVVCLCLASNQFVHGVLFWWEFRIRQTLQRSAKEWRPVTRLDQRTGHGCENFEEADKGGSEDKYTCKKGIIKVCKFMTRLKIGVFCFVSWRYHHILSLFFFFFFEEILSSQ
jgi:hypothetical protein